MSNSDISRRLRSTYDPKDNHIPDLMLTDRHLNINESDDGLTIDIE